MLNWIKNTKCGRPTWMRHQMLRLKIIKTINMKHTPGFNKKLVQEIKVHEFFFFPKGRKRMCCIAKNIGINYTQLVVCGPSGRHFRKEILNDTHITVYE